MQYKMLKQYFKTLMKHHDLYNMKLNLHVEFSMNKWWTCLLINRSPFLRKGTNNKSFGDLSFPDNDISFVSSGRQSVDRMFPSLYDHVETAKTPRLSSASSIFDWSFVSTPSDRSFPMSIENSEEWSPYVMVITQNPLTCTSNSCMHIG